MIVKLTPQQLDYIVNKLLNNEPGFAVFFEQCKCNEGGKAEVEIDADSADYLRDKSLERQQAVGFDENYNLNDEGELLDEIADIFFFNRKA